jgi:hypothetical protein
VRTTPSGAPGIGDLKAAVDAAVVASRTPPTPDATSWPATLPRAHLRREDWFRVWDVVRYLRREQRDTYNAFVQERTVADFIVDYLTDAPKDVTIDDVVADLRARVAREKSWLVEMPIMNLRPPREAVALGEHAMLVRTDWTRRAGPRFGSYLQDVWAVTRHLRDELTPRDRWLRASLAREVDLDTRKTASLLLVEEGTEEVAISLAESRARLAVAMWCLLTPPRSRYTPNPLWPTVGRWTPAAHVEFGLQRKLYEPGDGFRRGRARRRGNWTTSHGEYRLTRSDAYLNAPFVAMTRARRGNDCALALLSAARSLYLAERVPNGLDRTERVMFAWRAKEALSHRRGQGKSSERWQRLVANLRLRSELQARGYEANEIDDAFELVESLRDLTTHLADDVLVNLGYPEQVSTHLTRGRVLDADSLSLARVAADWPVILETVRLAARRLAKGALRNAWSEKWFHSRFA